MKIRSTFFRSRWTAIGVAVTVSAVAGSFAIVGAAPGDGAPSSFVPVTPCRLFDTRASAPVGARNTPLGPGQTFVQQVSGANGNCTLPAGITGVALNVTIVNPSGTSFLTLWPSDAPQPLASNLNWVAGQAPTPNKVDVRVSADGKLSLFNNGGTVDVVADVVGFYQAAGAGGGVDPKKVIVDAAAFSTDGDSLNDRLVHDFADGSVQGTSASPACGQAQVHLPNGATVTSITAHGFVTTPGPGTNLRVQMWRNPVTIEASEKMFEATSAGDGIRTLNGAITASPVIDNVNNSYYVTACGLTSAPNILFDVIVNYS